jgi:hypothetical protein
MTTTRSAQHNTSGCGCAPAAERPAPHTTSGCGCGCAPAAGECCRLECLERPNFFPGQLLHDSDLKTLVAWTRAKQRLVRQRHGWGVVCGLEVRADRKQPAKVIVASGYAIDCCGNEIVLCADGEPYDLGPWCGKGAEPCLEFEARPNPVIQPQRSKSTTRTIPPETITLAGKEFREVRVFDLLIHYDELNAEPRRVYGSGGCGPRPECKPSRVREWYRLSVRPAAETAEAANERVGQWEEGLKKCRKLLDKVLATRGNRRQVLLTWLAEHPLTQFGFVEQWLHELSDVNEAELAQALLYIVLDCQNRYIAAGCASCKAADGVPLARVWVHSADGDTCRVLAIDSSPPHRRPIGADPLPAPAGEHNLAHLLWMRPDDAVRALNALGIPAQSTTIPQPKSSEELSKLFDVSVLLSADTDKIALSDIDAGAYGRRVVAIRPAPPIADQRNQPTADRSAPKAQSSATPSQGAQTILAAPPTSPAPSDPRQPSSTGGAGAAITGEDTTSPPITSEQATPDTSPQQTPPSVSVEPKREEGTSDESKGGNA